MSNPEVLVVTDASGTIVAAHLQHTIRRDVSTFIAPADPGHTLHKVADVPAEICDTDDPHEFHRKLTEHFSAPSTRVSQTSAAELDAALHRRG
jgi:hypothetical protein